MDYAAYSPSTFMTLSSGEFLRRFLLHVLPRGFVRIRHYGFMANCHRQEKLDLCRQLLDQAAFKPALAATTAPGSVSSTDTESPAPTCPMCGHGRMIVSECRERPALADVMQLILWDNSS